MQQGQRLLVGAVITFIGMAIGLGGVEAASGLIFMSIICTLGISLVIWLPVCWVVGWISLGIYQAIAQQTGFLRVTETASSTPQNRLSLSPDRQALVNYAKKARSSGLSDTQIASRLAAQGWNNEEIEFAQRMANE